MVYFCLNISGPVPAPGAVAPLTLRAIPADLWAILARFPRAAEFRNDVIPRSGVTAAFTQRRLSFLLIAGTRGGLTVPE
jgi:hypothetical protein